MSGLRMVATKPEPVKSTRKVKKAAQTPKPVRKSKPAPAAAPESPAPEPAGDWWAASHLTIQMLAVVLKRYALNEGKWQRRDVQADLLQAHVLVSTYLERGEMVIH